MQQRFTRKPGLFRREPDWIKMVKILLMLIGLCIVIFFFMTYQLPIHEPKDFEGQERQWLVTKGWFFLSAPVAILILYYCFKDKEKW